MARGRRHPRDPGMTPFKAGLLAAVVILVATFFGFSRFNPFADPYKLEATFESANNLQPKSPVRIAGLDVGKVTKVEPVSDGSGAARVEMELERRALPIHVDAQLKIRPRIFLEGNFFVDLQPGTPSAPLMKDGGHVPVQQTATPVQFGDILNALQRDTRSDLQIFFKEYAREGLGNGGAKAYNKALTNAPEALRNASIANEAALGERRHDLSRLLRGQTRLFRLLATNPEVLKDLITNLNATAEAFGRNDVALREVAPTLRDVLRAGEPALISLNNTLPTLRTFAREALPGVRSSGPTIDASMPFIRQARLLVRESELRGLVRDLRAVIPDLARVNRGAIPLLEQQRAVAGCNNKVLVPFFALSFIVDPDFAGKPGYEGASGQQPYFEFPRGLVGLAGESRIMDANTPFFHIQFDSGPSNVLFPGEGETFIAGAGQAPEATRPAKPTHKPPIRPGFPCQASEPPDLNAPKGDPEEAVLANGDLIPPGVIPDLPLAPFPKKGKIQPQTNSQYAAATVNPESPYSDDAKLQFTWVLEWARLKREGQNIPDPLAFSVADYPDELERNGWQTDDEGHIKPRPGGKRK